MRILALAAIALSLCLGCTTRGRFVVPDGTQLEVYRRPVVPDAGGMVETKPCLLYTSPSPRD